MDELQDLLAKLRSDRNVRRIAKAANIPYGTLRKLRDLETSNPKYETVEKLRRYYDGQQAA